MTLDFYGFIDDNFRSFKAQRTTRAGTYIDGRWVPDAITSTTNHEVTLQVVRGPLIDSLTRGGERVIDVRRGYINDGDIFNISPADTWTFDTLTGTYKMIDLDNRPWRNYCKIIVSLIDDQ